MMTRRQRKLLLGKRIKNRALRLRRQASLLQLKPRSRFTPKTLHKATGLVPHRYTILTSSRLCKIG